MLRFVLAMGLACCLVLGCAAEKDAGETDGCSHRSGEWSLELVVDGRALPTTCVGGTSYVLAKEKEIYAIRVRNASTETVGVMVTVDGLSIRTREENPVVPYRSVHSYILAAGVDGLFKGWRLNREEVEAFVFTPVEDSIAAGRGQPGRVEAAVYVNGAEKTLYHHKSMRDFTGGGSRQLGTGAGPRVRSRLGSFYGTYAPRISDRPEGHMWLEYDSLEGLAARGITLPAGFQVPEPLKPPN